MTAMDKKAFFAVLVAALGYFVDIYDLILFSVVRVQSLEGIGLSGAALTDTSVLMINMQMGGMLLGGFLWGILGDKKGRLSILFGSILMYSLANIANAFVTTVPAYALCRFIAGIGLAGELGAGITLVAETLPKNRRGIGTSVVAAVGVAGGLAASLVGDAFDWKTAYIVGGCMGLALFALRVGVSESGLFAGLEKSHIRKGDLRMLFCNWPRLKRFACCAAIGLPLWFIVGLIMTFAPEIGRELGIDGAVTSSRAIMFFYGGLVGGDLASGLVSQFLKSRRKAVGIFTVAAAIGTYAILFMPKGASPHMFYALAGVTGFFAGYWALFVTVAAEQFGTNLRATVATAVPNIVRGSSILFLSAFTLLKPHTGILHGIALIGVFVFTVALTALWSLRETFTIDLDYTEE
jgi:MFS transporter, putative metabolite:H+ symporter